MTTKTLMTAEELLKMPKDGYRYELNQGELKKMSPAGGKHGAIAMKFGARLEVFVEDNDLGTVYAAETGYKVKQNPDDVKAPDVSFISKERLPGSEIPDSYLTTVPELVVEVISPNDSKKEVEGKVQMWFEFGVSVVVVINPRRHSVTLYHSPTNSTNLSENDTLVLDDVVPGFSYPISRLFR
jgi:Uma2 family endonuclease